MAIQNRRGSYQYFEPDHMVEGEWGFVLDGDPNSIDGTGVYACFGDGKVKKMCTYADMQAQFNESTQQFQDRFYETGKQTIHDARVVTEETRQQWIKCINVTAECQKQVNLANNIIAQGPVAGFNGRVGAVVPQKGDYTASQIIVSKAPGEKTVASELTRLESKIDSSFSNVREVVIWENSDASKAFAAQTIKSFKNGVKVSDLADFDSIRIECQVWTDALHTFSDYVRANHPAMVSCPVVNSNSPATVVVGRTFRVASDGLACSIGFYRAASSIGTLTQNTSAAIPVRMIGIKRG